LTDPITKKLNISHDLRVWSLFLTICIIGPLTVYNQLQSNTQKEKIELLVSQNALLRVTTTQCLQTNNKIRVATQYSTAVGVRCADLFDNVFSDLGIRNWGADMALADNAQHPDGIGPVSGKESKLLTRVHSGNKSARHKNHSTSDNPRQMSKQGGAVLTNSKVVQNVSVVSSSPAGQQFPLLFPFR
jgi:hypothetical protein